MARHGLVERERHRAVLAARFRDRRDELKALIAAPGTAPGVRAAAVRRPARLPRDSSPVRGRVRDSVDGRPRGVLRKYRALPRPVPRDGPAW